MKQFGRIAFHLHDNLWQIRIYYKEKDIIEPFVVWPDGAVGQFIGYTLNGYLKYKFLGMRGQMEKHES